MGTTADKLQYTANAVNDIKSAIISKGVSVSDTEALGNYGSKIRSIKSITDLGTAQSFDLTKITNDYKNLTASNFIIEAASCSTSNASTQQSGSKTFYASAHYTISKSYNSSTGVLTASASVRATISSDAGLSMIPSKTVNVHVYLIQ